MIGKKIPNWTKCNMRTFKITVVIVLSVIFTLTLTACADEDNSSKAGKQTSVIDSVESKAADSNTNFDDLANPSDFGTKRESETTTTHKETEGDTTKNRAITSTDTTAPKKDVTSSDKIVSDSTVQKTKQTVSENSTSKSSKCSSETTDSNAPIELEEIDF